MEVVTVTSVSELTSYLEGIEGRCLFRGQIEHFVAEGEPSVVTSFDRKGCIPSEMLRWSKYAKNVLEFWLGPKSGSLEFTQALLQHYGWRSFYVDCSANAAVAAWFASHTYTERLAAEMCEDCFEDTVFLQKRFAHYDYVEGEGHLYVFDHDLASASIGLTDLAALGREGIKPRPVVQDAWLMGSFRNRRVPIECFKAHVRGDRRIFREFAENAGLSTTNQLFPPVADDPILAALLELPWRQIGKQKDVVGIPAFHRGLDLPEYQDSFDKISPSRVAFFQGTRIGDMEVAGAKAGAIVVAAPDIVFFGSADPTPLVFPGIEELLQKHPCVAFELDDLIKRAPLDGSTIYQKGIVVWEHEKDLIEVCELGVKHPGLQLTAASLAPGWHYKRASDGEWRRHSHPDDCPCDNNAIHESHASALHIADAFLQNPDDDWK